MLDLNRARLAESFSFSFHWIALKPIISSMTRLILVTVFVVLALPVAAQVDQGAIDEAEETFKTGDYGTALRLFRQLRAKGKEPGLRLRLQWNIGRSLEKMGETAEAIMVFEDYLATVNDPVRSARAEAKLQELKRRQTGAIAIKCDHSKVTVSLEGMPDKNGPCPQLFESIVVGPYVVIGKLPDGSLSRAMVTVEADATAQARVFFNRPVVKPAAASLWPWYVGGSVILVTAGVLTYLALSSPDSKTTQTTRFCFETDCP